MNDGHHRGGGSRPLEHPNMGKAKQGLELAASAASIVGLIIAFLANVLLSGLLAGFEVWTTAAIVAMAALSVGLLMALAVRFKVARRQMVVKRDLIARMRSAVNDVAIAAAEELRAQGWLADGSLVGDDLEHADLATANLSLANLRGANLSGANLERVNLAGANLKEAYLRRARLRGAHLWHVSLEGADLEGADLEEANLEGTNLSRANLQRANLEGANLRGTDLSEVKLERASYDDQTIWPEGFTPPPEALKVEGRPEQTADDQEIGE